MIVSVVTLEASRHDFTVSRSGANKTESRTPWVQDGEAHLSQETQKISHANLSSRMLG